MKKIFVLSVLVLFALVSKADFRDTLTLKPKAIYGREAKVISDILDSRHYRKIALNDSLSAAILQQYVGELDNNRMFFLASDIQVFEKYKTTLDDFTRKEDVSPAYEIYAVFQKRYAERMDYLLKNLINQDFDYTVDEYFE